MLKIEYIWRELLFRAIEKKEETFTNLGLAKKFGLSTSMVAHALYPLRNLGMIEVAKTQSRIIDTERLLFYWATRRNLKKEVIYEIYSSLSVFEREGSMPAEVFPTAYSFYRLYFPNPPADYDHIYFYAKNIETIAKRFPNNSNKEPNIFILQEDPYLPTYQKVPLAQVFADLWNLPEWYAREFSEGVLAKIRERIGL